jgi:hypothetical protein
MTDYDEWKLRAPDEIKLTSLTDTITFEVDAVDVKIDAWIKRAVNALKSMYHTEKRMDDRLSINIREIRFGIPYVFSISFNMDYECIPDAEGIKEEKLKMESEFAEFGFENGEWEN